MEELIQQLVSQLGIDAGQAKGGAGLLFKMAQSKLGGDFSIITRALPAVKDLIQAAPSEGGASRLLGGLASAIGGGKADGLAGLASLAGGFSKLNLDPGMIGKFAPIVLAFLKDKVGPDAAGLVARILN